MKERTDLSPTINLYLSVAQCQAKGKSIKEVLAFIPFKLRFHCLVYDGTSSC